jgi:hypothetical protein
VEAFFDFIAPLILDVIAFVARFWPSLLLIAGALLLERSGRRAPRIAVPPAIVAYATVFALSLAACIGTLHFRGQPPLPGFEDDWAYLLSADTFLHGRLTNPPHPLARHFEAFYTLQAPTYSSMYLPGNGLVLAFGRLIAGNALIGMTIATLLAAVAILWALRGWVSEGWAFAVACLVAVHPVITDWSGSFHGGSVTALGGALVAGAAARLRREPRLLDGLAFGAGALLLGITRPYEGLVIGAVFTIMVIASAPRRRLVMPAAAAMIIVALGAAAVMRMNRAVTGRALVLPYGAYKARYLSAPLFIWQSAGAPLHLPNPDMAFIERHYRNYYFRIRQPREYVRTATAESVMLLQSSLPIPRERDEGAGRVADSLWLLQLFPFAIFVTAMFRDRNAAAIGLALAAECAALVVETGFPQLHYAAPAVAAFAIAVGIGFSRRPAGDWLAVASFGAILVAAVVLTVASWTPWRISERTRMIAALQAKPGPHLVLVEQRCDGYVRNGAAIDDQRIVWARDLGDDAELLRYYADRSVWSVRCGDGDRLAFVRAPLRASIKRAFENYP